MSTDNIDQMPQMAEWFMRRYHKCVPVPVKSKYTGQRKFRKQSKITKKGKVLWN